MADEPRHSHRPTAPRFTHVALPIADVDASIAFYERHTPLRLLDRRVDGDGSVAWLSDPDTVDAPFVLVLAHFFSDAEKGRQPTLAPFAHIGIELPTREAVDEIAARGEADGCLAWPAQWIPPPVGYVCALTDPDGNMVEFSYDQGIYEAVRRG